MSTYEYMRENQYTDLGGFSFFVEISNGHARAEAEVFPADHAVRVFLQVLEEAVKRTGRVMSMV